MSAKNKPYAQYPQTQDHVSRHRLFKVQKMNGQNIKKYRQEELNLMCLTCKKTGKYIFSFAARQKPRKLNTQKWVNF